MLLRIFALVIFALQFVFCMVRPTAAQQETAALTPLNIDKADAKAFAIFFRRENSYLRIARSAASPDKPDANLAYVIPKQFQLDAADLASVEQVASDWERDTKILRSEFVNVVAQFHSSFPNGRLRPGVDTIPPPDLADLRAEMDAVTLKYRDELRNAMRESDFQRLQMNVLKAFTNNTHEKIPPVTTSSLATGEVK
ncbi:MAG TPA: hypothetical protein VNW54_16530 [Granulicella sp.]|jgi:hypothetical protein|nr:hypothetical protein [Granulicella sp.]